MSMNLYMEDIELFQTQTDVTQFILKTQEEKGYENARDAYVAWLVKCHGAMKLHSTWALKNIPNYRGYKVSDILFEHIWKLHALGTNVHFSMG